jgi:hypothetical protein
MIGETPGQRAGGIMNKVITALLLSSAALGAPTDVETGEIVVGKGDGEFAPIRNLVLDGKPQPAGAHSADNTPQFIKGAGVLRSI